MYSYEYMCPYWHMNPNIDKYMCIHTDKTIHTDMSWYISKSHD